jgi:HEAT repeat protein
MFILKSVPRSLLLGSLLLAIALPLFGQNSSGSPQAQADQCLAVLKSNAPQKDKADACRALAVIGTPESVSVLAGLLADEQLAHMARYALEPIPSPAVDDALRQKLDELKGKLLVGVIGSVGVRRDLKATDKLAQLLNDNDTDVSQAAARALGRLGTTEAVQALRTTLAKTTQTTPANRLACFEGLLRCAERLLLDNKRNEAIAVYDQLRSGDAPYQVRVGSLIQAIVVRQKEGLPLLAQSLRNEEYATFAAAVKAAQSMPGPEAGQILIDEMTQLTDDRQILILQTLGMRKDAGVVAAVSARVRNGSKPVQLAALKTLTEIGSPEAMSVFTECLKDKDAEIKQAAQEGLASLPGQGVDAAITAMVNSQDTDSRLQGLDLVGRRHMADASPVLMKAAQDNDPKVRVAAFKKLGELGMSSDLAPVLALLVKANAAPDREAAEQALTAIYSKLDAASAADKSVAEQFQNQVRSTIATAPETMKISLLSVLSLDESPRSLEILRNSLKDNSGEIRTASIRLLSKWKATDVSSDLLDVAKNAAQANEKTLGLRGYLTLAANTDLPADKRLAMCQDAAPLAQRDEEKRLLLGALSNIPSVDALKMTTPMVDSEATRDEASSAVVSIADKLVKADDAAKNAPAVIEPLQKVIQVNANADLTRKAKNLLKDAQGKAGK